MGIKWYKNIYYWLAIIVGAIIISLAIFTVVKNSIGLFTPDGKVVIFSLETLYRSVFNPLWVIVLWLIDRGIKENHKKYHEILQNIQGLLLGTKSQENIDRKTLYEIVYKHDFAEERLEDELNKADTVDTTPSNPMI